MREIREQRWRDELELGLRAVGKTGADIAHAGPSERWKIEIAAPGRRALPLDLGVAQHGHSGRRMNVFRFLKPVTA